MMIYLSNFLSNKNNDVTLFTFSHNEKLFSTSENNFLITTFNNSKLVSIFKIAHELRKYDYIII